MRPAEQRDPDPGRQPTRVDRFLGPVLSPRAPGGDPESTPGRRSASTTAAGDLESPIAAATAAARALDPLVLTRNHHPLRARRPSVLARLQRGLEGCRVPSLRPVWCFVSTITGRATVRAGRPRPSGLSCSLRSTPTRRTRGALALSQRFRRQGPDGASQLADRRLRASTSPARRRSRELRSGSVG